MKRTILIFATLIFAVLTVSAQDMADKKESKKNDKISEVTLSCKMDCGNCANDVKKQLAFTKGVKYVETDFEKDLVVVKYRNDRTDADKIIASLGEIKYAASVYNPGCGSVKKGCCSGKTTTSTSGCSSKTTDAQHSGCSGKTTDAQHSGCAGKTATTGEAKTGCCSGKTVEPSNK